MAITDAEYEATKVRIKAATDRWVVPCGLRWWQQVVFEYHRDTLSMVDAAQVPVSELERQVGGRAVCDWRYKTATIHLNVAIIYRLTDEELDYLIRHEICHLLVHEMREWNKDRGIDHEERVCTELAMVLHWVRTAGKEDAEKVVDIPQTSG